MTPPILDWSAACEAGPARAGGKGWQLGVLAEFGAPVPPGFVIDATASAGRHLGDPLPASLVTTMAQTLESRGWDKQPLAVRSSAAMEDSARASFAGVYRSVLNVRGLDATVRAVREVWDSRWAPAAVAYRQRLGIIDHDIAMAVVIMPLLPAVASGIGFTTDPVSGRDQFVIHAHWGLGEALVSGQAEPDEYRIQHNLMNDSLSLIEQHRGRKGRTTVAAAGGGTELRDTPTELATRSVLTIDQATALAELLRDAAWALDYADPRYDVEWIWDGQQFWIVQARPITARGRYTYPALSNQPSVWSRANSRDVVPDPLSPLDWSLSVLDQMLTQSTQLAGYEILPGLQRTALRFGRLYFETSIIQWEYFDGFDLAPKALNRLIGGHQPEIAVPKATLRERLARVRRSVRYLRRCVRPRLQAKAALQRVRQQAATWLAMPLPKDNAELAQQLREQFNVIRRAGDLFFLQASSGSVVFILLDLVEKYCPGEGHPLTAVLLAGGNPSVTATQGFELMKLARIAAADPRALGWLRRPNRIGADWSRQLPEDSPFRRAFAQFIQCYGHRGVYESYLRNPRWREAPDYLFDSIVNLMGSDPAPLHERQQQALIQARRRVAGALPLWYHPWLPLLIKFATVEQNLREAARSALIAYFEVLRRGALAVGQRFAEPSGLDRPEDIFNLTFLEVLGLAEGQLAIVAAAKRAAWRRGQVDNATMQVGPEVIIEHDDVRPSSAPAATNAGEVQVNLWQGTVVSNGQAQGLAHIAHHPTEAVNMATGAILVVPSTDPSWTPQFLRAAALVMETGGYLSHGAIVAREFGIPAVVNLPGILNSIGTGDCLEVDGNRGTVRRLKSIG